MRIGALALAAALVVVGASVASADDAPIVGSAEATATATRAAVAPDLVSVSEPSKLTSAVEADVAAAAREAGGAALPGRSAQIDLIGIRRGTTVVQAPPSGYAIPMGLTVVPFDAARAVMSDAVATALNAGQLVIGETSAALRGARAGDLVDLVDAGGGVRTFVIGLVAPDPEVGGAELVLRTEDAALLGVQSNTRMIVWGFDSRSAIDAALRAHGLERFHIRIVRSWDAPSPDSTIGLARTKALLGEFAFRRLSPSGAISLDPSWVDAHIHPRMTFAGIGVRASCNNAIVPAIQGALQELADQGLGGLIDLASTNSVGGCYSPRLNTVTGNLGFLSRHTWAQALDLNVAQNPQGRAPRLDCRVVRVFRKWGFAWGGNFVNPDGMHFEYVGEPRDQLAFPSPYCPNVIPGSAVRVDGDGGAAVGDGGRPTAVFADDGLPDGGE